MNEAKVGKPHGLTPVDANVVCRDIFDCHGGILAQKEEEVLPRYGLRSTYATTLSGILPISAF